MGCHGYYRHYHPQLYVDPIVSWRWEWCFPWQFSESRLGGWTYGWWRVPQLWLWGSWNVNCSSHDLFTKQMVETPPTKQIIPWKCSTHVHHCTVVHIGHRRLLYPRTSQFMIANKTSIAIPSGKRLHNYGKIHTFSWENPRTKWWFSIVMLQNIIIYEVAPVHRWAPRWAVKIHWNHPWRNPILNRPIIHDENLRIPSFFHIPNLVMTFTVRHGKWMALIEIDALPINSMVDLSMANCECHNQMVSHY